MYEARCKLVDKIDSCGNANELGIEFDDIAFISSIDNDIGWNEFRLYSVANI